MHPLFSLATIRASEQQALAQGEPLMERAGLAAAQWVQQLYPHITRILVLVGPGNNGGDGLVCARHLQQAGYQVKILLATTPPNQGDAQQAYQDWLMAGGQAAITIDQPQLIIDALFGIGLNRPLDTPYNALIHAANAAPCPILALDTPSGLNAMTGITMGPSIRAQHTITFIADKPGLYTGQGCDSAGTVLLADLGCATLMQDPAAGVLIDYAPDGLALLKRAQNTHKGHYGTVGILGGAPGMVGAALLAGRAALHCGAGRVQVGFLTDPAPIVDWQQPELMLSSAEKLATTASLITHWLIGPGLGQANTAHLLLAHLLATQQPLILDADALNLIAVHADLQRLLSQRTAATILTPHPAEAARLLGCSATEVQADRIGAAQQLAQRYPAVILLKGCGSIVCDAQSYSINHSGNAALSNAGQGDTLGGILVALLAQGLTPLEATQSAAWLHGAAADLWCETHPGKIGLTASEAGILARDILNQHIY